MLYFRDAYSDMLSIADRVDSQREMLSGLMEIYLSTMSNNLNNVMKKLTLVTSLILVPSFIAGLYGMNVALPLEDLGQVLAQAGMRHGHRVRPVPDRVTDPGEHICERVCEHEASYQPTN